MCLLEENLTNRVIANYRKEKCIIPPNSWQNIKVALSISDLSQKTNNFSRKNAPKCTASLYRVEKTRSRWMLKVKCAEKTSDPSGHIVRLRAEPGSGGQLKERDIRVSCTCVAPGMRVWMADGTEKSIELVEPGDLVMTHKGRARKVKFVMRRKAELGEQAVRIKVRGYRDPLIVSKDHPLAVVRGNELCACGCGKKLPNGYASVTRADRWQRRWIRGHYKRPVREYDYSDGRICWMKSEELLPREVLYFPTFEWAGRDAVNKDFAAICGYYLAEGSISKRQRKSELALGGHVGTIRNLKGRFSVYGVKITLNQDECETIACDIVARMKRINKCAEVRVKKIYSGSQKWLEVVILDCELACELVRLFGEGSLSKSIAPEVFGWDKDSIKELVLAHALGDGYVGNQKMMIGSSSFTLIRQLSHIVFSLGVWNGFTYQDKENSNTKRAYRLNINYSKYPLITDGMYPVMRQNNKERVQASGEDEPEIWGSGFLRTLLDKKLIDYDEEYFYDLTVEEDESFIVNGVVVHNCPAFLYWGARYLSQNEDYWDGTGPKVVPPTDKLHLKRNFYICKHIYTAFQKAQSYWV